MAVSGRLSLVAGVLAAITLLMASPGDAFAKGVRHAQKPIPGRYIVVYRNKGAEVARAGDEVDVDDEANKLVGKYKARVRESLRHAVKGLVVEMSPDEAELLSADPGVALVEEDGIISIHGTQTGATWGLDRIDQANLPLNKIYNYNNEGAGVTAYVIDTGIRASHAEFGGRAQVGADFTAGTQTGVDCHGHGTHVAGTVGGATYGVAKRVSLVAVRVFDCSGSGSISGVIAGVDWVTADRKLPAVANMSLGGATSTALDAAVTNSIASGITYVVSAGNSNANACNVSPARVAGAVTVGATTSTDVRASYSNWGSCLDLFAPGSSVVSSWLTSDTATTTLSGTSMAAPHVSGVAALYLAAEPALTPQQVATRLINDATLNKVSSRGTNSPNRLLFNGKVAVVATDTTAPVIGAVGFGSAQPLSGTVALSVTASDNAALARIDFVVDGNVVGSATGNLGSQPATYTLNWSSAAVLNGEHSFSAFAYDSSGNAATSPTVVASTSNTQVTQCFGNSQLLLNPSFESGEDGSWTASASVIAQRSLFRLLPRTGTWDAVMLGFGDGVPHSAVLHQTVSIPVDVCSAKLSFWMKIYTSETVTTPADTLAVTVQSPTGTVLKTLANYSNLDAIGGYLERTFDLTAYRGSTVRLHFGGSENALNGSSFIIDDVTLTVTR
jgi:subtilisin family serine protease